MSDMKCPICGQELEVMVWLSKAVLGCPKCKHIATIGVWEELMRTKKQLEIALTCMNGVTKDLPWVKRALDEIKELDKGGDNE